MLQKNRLFQINFPILIVIGKFRTFFLIPSMPSDPKSVDLDRINGNVYISNNSIHFMLVQSKIDYYYLLVDFSS